MKKFILLLSVCFILVGSNIVVANDNANNLDSYFFLPQVIESKNVKLSNIIKELYIKKFLSDDSSSTISKLNIDSGNVEFNNDFKHKEIKWLNWELLNDLGDGAYLIYRDITFKDGVEKRLVYHTRWHSWRGKIYTGYIINKGEDILKTNYYENSEKFFYPSNGLSAGGSWSWWINNVFEYEGNYYYITEFDNFNKNSGIRYIVKINSDGSLEVVAKLKVYMSLNEILAQKYFSIYKAYLLSLDNIMGEEPPASGTLHSHTRAVMAGDYGATMAILRPWVLIDEQTEGKYTDLKKFLKWCAYGGIWKLREYQTFNYHLNLTAKELKKFYINSYSIDAKQAEIMGKNAVWDVINSYMVISSHFKRNYTKEDIENSNNGKLAKGISVNWDEVKDDYQLASLVIDSVENIEGIHRCFAKEKLNTRFNKNLLMYAAHMNNYKAVIKLIDLGYSVNDKTIKAQSWIKTPFVYKRTALMYAAENASIEIIRKLINEGAKIDAVDSKGRRIDYYLSKNPRFTKTEKQMGLNQLIKKYEDSNQIFKPSFDPKKASTKIEKEISNNKTLSIYDREMGKAYRKLIALSNQPELVRKNQLNWLKIRNKIAKQADSKHKFIIVLSRLIRARTRYFYQRIQSLEN